jgi:polyisoprenyl-teichoic acid--peptidoglycan teichoic acid transferase
MFEHLDDPRPPAFGAASRHAVVRRAHRRRRRQLAGGMGVAAATLVAGAGGLYGRAAWRLGQVERTEVAGTADVPAGEPVTVLVRGVDARTGPDDAGRSDTLLLARLDPGAGTASLLSLPRDLLVADPATGAEVRVNELGAGAQVAVAESQLGVPVDHVVEVGLDGFRALVDLVGGVEVRVDAAVRDTRSGLFLDELGCVTLDGEEALALVRSRYRETLDDSGRWVVDPMADLGRAATQRAVVVAALADLAGRADPISVDRLAGWLAEHVTVDTALDTGDLADLVRAALAVDPVAVTVAQLPVTTAPGDANRFAVDETLAPVVVDAFRSGEPAPAGPLEGEPAVAAC